MRNYYLNFITLCVFFFALINFSLFAQPGCTDTHATNYNSGATVNDGSCVYSPTILNLDLKCVLDSPLLKESSGIVDVDGSLWTEVDDSNNNIYRVDSLSDSVFQVLNISQASNTDWEDITSDSNYIYIGDFGNNDGNRTDLHILRIAKSNISTTTTSVIPEIINFSYADQTDFTPNHNNNPFDCEAFFIWNDSVHLFSKDWVNDWTKHYVLPAIPGVQVAQLVDSFDVNCHITSAAIQDDGLIALLGYKTGSTYACYLWMLNDYHGTYFFSGNKRMFDLGSAFFEGQTEGICFRGNNYGYISNEQIQQGVYILPAQIKSFDLTQYVIPVTAKASELSVVNDFNLFPTVSSDKLTLSLRNNISTNLSLVITDISGRRILYKLISPDDSQINIEPLASGIYFVNVFEDDQLIFTSRVIKS